MKTLLIMRHAKSSWKEKDLDDIQRPLAKRGLRDSDMMGELITDRELTPQVIFTSSAVRCTQTAALIAKAGSFNCPIQTVDALYLAEAETLLQELRKIDNQYERVMIIGHNPGLEYLVQLLTDEIVALPTAVIAYLNLPLASWSDLDTKVEGQLVELWKPKELRATKEEHEEEEEHAGKEKDKKKKKDKDKDKKK